MNRIAICLTIGWIISGNAYAQVKTPSETKVEVAEKKYAAAMQRESDAFWTTTVAADKALLADLEIAVRVAKGPDASQASSARDSAKARLAMDTMAMQQHQILSEAEPPSDQQREITVAQLSSLGGGMIGKQVTLNVKFDRLDNGSVMSLPGVRRSGSGSVGGQTGLSASEFTSQMQSSISSVQAPLGKNYASQWAGISLADNDGSAQNCAFAPVDSFASILSTFKSGDKIKIIGTVVSLSGGTRFGIICQKIENGH